MSKCVWLESKNRACKHVEKQKKFRRIRISLNRRLMNVCITCNIRRIYKAGRNSLAAVQFNKHLFFLFLFKLNSMSVWYCLLPLDFWLFICWKNFSDAISNSIVVLIEYWVLFCLNSTRCFWNAKWQVPLKGRFSYKNLIWDLSHRFETNHFDFWLKNNCSFFHLFLTKTRPTMRSLIGCHLQIDNCIIIWNVDILRRWNAVTQTFLFVCMIELWIM